MTVATGRRVGRRVLDAAVGAHGEPVGADQRAEQIATQPLEPGAVARIDDGVGVQREAVDQRRTAPRRPAQNAHLRADSTIGRILVRSSCSVC
jgi:hypothetical protein